MAEQAPISDSSPGSTPALISFGILIIWAATVGALFALLYRKVPVDPVLVASLGGIISAETACLSAITGFWLASSLTANRANASKEAALTQLAGAGPPPPANPLDAPPEGKSP